MYWNVLFDCLCICIGNWSKSIFLKGWYAMKVIQSVTVKYHKKIEIKE